MLSRHARPARRPRRTGRPGPAFAAGLALVLVATGAAVLQQPAPADGSDAVAAGWFWKRPPGHHHPVPTATAGTPAPATPTPGSGATSTTAPGQGTSPSMPSMPSMPSHSGMPGGATGNPYVPVDASRIPVGSNGSGERLLRAGGGLRGESDNGEFRTVCTFSHLAFDDPIVKPGQPGASHLHAFFGNTGTNANSTPESIRDSGNSTCRGGILNRTAYWVPALIDTRTGTPVRPEYIDAYYKNGFGGLRPDQIHPLPQGLRMVAGSAMTTQPQTRQTGQWACDDGTGRVYRFWDHVPDYCAPGDSTGFEVDFPQCWDGKNLDSADHKSHMAYTLDGGRGCPATHPVAIPAISIVTHWTVPAGATATDLRLASDMYPTSNPGGWSWHADWFDGWDEQTMQTWVKNCNNAGKNCFSHLIADGQTLYGER